MVDIDAIPWRFKDELAVGRIPSTFSGVYQFSK
jgi:hypothetical protein